MKKIILMLMLILSILKVSLVKLEVTILEPENFRLNETQIQASLNDNIYFLAFMFPYGNENKKSDFSTETEQHELLKNYFIGNMEKYHEYYYDDWNYGCPSVMKIPKVLV